MDKVDFEEFDRKYTTVEFEDTISGTPDMLETYGEELQIVKKSNPKTVWTIIDGEGERMYIIAGMHWVNRINYVITEEEWQDENEEYVWC